MAHHNSSCLLRSPVIVGSAIGAATAVIIFMGAVIVLMVVMLLHFKHRAKKSVDGKLVKILTSTFFQAIVSYRCWCWFVKESNCYVVLYMTLKCLAPHLSCISEYCLVLVKRELQMTTSPVSSYHLRSIITITDSMVIVITMYIVLLQQWNCDGWQCRVHSDTISPNLSSFPLVTSW